MACRLRRSTSRQMRKLLSKPNAMRHIRRRKQRGKQMLNNNNNKNDDAARPGRTEGKPRTDGTVIRTTFASLKSIAFFLLILVVSAWSQGMGPGTVNPPANLRPPGLK